jgi:predicted RNase H-like nuclease
VSYQDWRRGLQEVVDAGLRDHRAAQVIAALGAEIAKAEKAPAAAPPPVPRTRPAVPTPVLGVDACSGGWVGVLLRPDAPLQVLLAETIGALVDLARETAPVTVAAIDIPIGLPDAGRRQADVQARRALPGKGSSVFTTLIRKAWLAPTRVAADEVSRAITGLGVGAQVWGLREKVVEVDDWLRTHPPFRVVESHPELCFAEMSGAPLLPSKRTAEGAAARRSALLAGGIHPPPFYAGQGYAEDDLLDACAVAWSAARCAAGTARSLPEAPEVFSDQLPAAIWV